MSSVIELTEWTDDVDDEEKSLQICSCGADETTFSSLLSTSEMRSSEGSDVTEIAEFARLKSPFRVISERENTTHSHGNWKKLTCSIEPPKKLCGTCSELLRSSHSEVKNDKVSKLSNTFDLDASSPKRLLTKADIETQRLTEADDLEHLRGHEIEKVVTLPNGVAMKSADISKYKLNVTSKEDQFNLEKTVLVENFHPTKDGLSVPKSSALHMRNECKDVQEKNDNLTRMYPLKKTRWVKESGDFFERTSSLQITTREKHVAGRFSKRANQVEQIDKLIKLGNTSEMSDDSVFSCVMFTPGEEKLRISPEIAHIKSDEKDFRDQSLLFNLHGDSPDMRLSYLERDMQKGNSEFHEHPNIDVTHFQSENPLTEAACRKEESEKSNFLKIRKTQISNVEFSNLASLRLFSAIQKFDNLLGGQVDCDKKSDTNNFEETNEDSIVFLPELPQRKTQISTLNEPCAINGSTKASLKNMPCTGDPGMTANLSRVIEVMIIEENDHTADARWPVSHATTSSHNLLVESCTEFSNDLNETTAHVTQPQGIIKVNYARSISLVESNEQLRIFQSFHDVIYVNLNVPGQFSEDKKGKKCSNKTSSSRSYSEMSGALQDDATFQEGIVISFEKIYQEMKNKCFPIEPKLSALKESEISQYDSADGLHLGKLCQIPEVLDFCSRADGFETPRDTGVHIIKLKATKLQKNTINQNVNARSNGLLNNTSPLRERIGVSKNATSQLYFLQAREACRYIALPDALELSIDCIRAFPNFRHEGLEITPISFINKRPKKTTQVSRTIESIIEEPTNTLCLVNPCLAHLTLIIPQSIIRKREMASESIVKQWFSEIDHLIPLKELSKPIERVKLSLCDHLRKRSELTKSQSIKLNNEKSISEFEEKRSEGPIKFGQIPSQKASEFHKAVEHTENLTTSRHVPIYRETKSSQSCNESINGTHPRPRSRHFFNRGISETRQSVKTNWTSLPINGIKALLEEIPPLDDFPRPFAPIANSDTDSTIAKRVNTKKRDSDCYATGKEGNIFPLRIVKNQDNLRTPDERASQVYHRHKNALDLLILDTISSIRGRNETNNYYLRETTSGNHNNYKKKFLVAEKYG